MLHFENVCVWEREVRIMVKETEIYKFNNILSPFLFLSYFPYGFQ